MRKPSVSQDGFWSFLHPSHNCKCCHPELQVAHPSVSCSCCQTEWERTDRSFSLEVFVKSKLDNAKHAAPVKMPAKPPTQEFINVAVKNAHFSSELQELLFGAEPVIQVDCRSMPELLVAIKVFSSKGQARKAGWAEQLPTGFCEMKVGRRRVTIWNPIEFNDAI